jgi:hypothetical protein
MAILSIIIGPILSLTLNSVKMNKKSDEKMEALSLAQKEMEGIKSPKYIIVNSNYTQVVVTENGITNKLTKNRTEGNYEITETLIIPSGSQIVDEFSIIEDVDADIIMKFGGKNIGVYDKNSLTLIKNLGEVNISSIVELKCNDSKLDLGLDEANKFSITTGSNFEIDIKIYLPDINLKMNIINFSNNGKVKLHFIKQHKDSAFTFNNFIGDVEYYSIDPLKLPNSSGGIYRLYEVKVTVKKKSTGEILQELRGYKKIS